MNCFLRAVKISVDEEVRAIDGRNLIVPCKVLGSPKTDAIWMDKKRIYVGNGGRISSRKNGNLEVDGVLLGDRGRYYCTSARDDPSQDRLGGVWLNVYGMYVRCSAPLMKRNVYDETSYSIYTTLH